MLFCNRWLLKQSIDIFQGITPFQDLLQLNIKIYYYNLWNSWIIAFSNKKSNKICSSFYLCLSSVEKWLLLVKPFCIKSYSFQLHCNTSVSFPEFPKFLPFSSLGLLSLQWKKLFNYCVCGCLPIKTYKEN